MEGSMVEWEVGQEVGSGETRGGRSVKEANGMRARAMEGSTMHEVGGEGYDGDENGAVLLHEIVEQPLGNPMEDYFCSFQDLLSSHTPHQAAPPLTNPAQRQLPALLLSHLPISHELKPIYRSQPHLSEPTSLPVSLRNLAPSPFQTSQKFSLAYTRFSSASTQLQLTNGFSVNSDENRPLIASLSAAKRRRCSTLAVEPRVVSHFVTERQRREFLNQKYQALRSLLPNPTKTDRASIVQDAIDYVKELKRTVQELRRLGQDKERRGGPGPKIRNAGKVTDRRNDNSERQQTNLMYDAPDNQLRSSWLQRSSKYGTEVDVRIVEDEVTIKLVQLKSGNSLLKVVLVLHELQLELLHANGARIGDFNMYMFNAKIAEGSVIYAGQLATRLIETADHEFSQHPTQPNVLSIF